MRLGRYTGGVGRTSDRTCAAPQGPDTHRGRNGQLFLMVSIVFKCFRSFSGTVFGTGVDDLWDPFGFHVQSFFGIVDGCLMS